MFHHSEFIMVEVFPKVMPGGQDSVFKIKNRYGAVSVLSRLATRSFVDGCSNLYGS